MGIATDLAGRGHDPLVSAAIQFSLNRRFEKAAGSILLAASNVDESLTFA